MKTTTVLFDLDGTLLPMDQETFAKAYIKGLVKTAEPLGYSPMIMTSAVMEGTKAMVLNNGEKTNEDVFWDVFAKTFGKSILNDYQMFDEFYLTDFQNIKDVCGFEKKANEIVKYVKEKGFRVALATNPLFPIVATESRIRWAGLEPNDFELYTTYEKSKYCKPNLNYYKEILKKLDVCAEECLMVGNDVEEDMIAEKLGMKVFLLTDCMINKKDKDISVYPHGSFDDLIEFLNCFER